MCSLQRVYETKYVYTTLSRVVWSLSLLINERATLSHIFYHVYIWIQWCYLFSNSLHITDLVNTWHVWVTLKRWHTSSILITVHSSPPFKNLISVPKTLFSGIHMYIQSCTLFAIKMMVALHIHSLISIVIQRGNKLLLSLTICWNVWSGIILAC